MKEQYEKGSRYILWYSKLFLVQDINSRREKTNDVTECRLLSAGNTKADTNAL